MSQTSTTGNGSKGAMSDERYEDLTHQIETLKGDISKLTQSLGALGRAEADRLGLKAQMKGEELRHSAEGYLHEGERYVRQQPAQALGIAAAAGFLVGFLISGRK